MSKLDDFMNMAISHRGYKGDWVWANAPQDRGHAWCAAFVWTCAKLSGCGNTIIPHNYAARMMCKLTYEKSHMRWMSRAYGGSQSFKPRRGDLVFFRWNKMPGAEWWVANHVGIVINTEGNYVNTIEGNRHGDGNNWISYVDYRRCSLDYDKLLCFVRPVWPGASYDDEDPAPPYDETPPVVPEIPGTPVGSTVELNTKNDASIREVGYLSSTGFSTVQSQIPLSVINYTSGLSTLMTAADVTPTYGASSEFILDGLSSNARAIAQQLVLGDYTLGSAIGVLGNIQRESGFNPEHAQMNGSGRGLCSWSGDRLKALKRFVGTGWGYNLSGQTSYLLYEIGSVSTFHTKLYDAMTTYPNSKDGAEAAAELFYRWYILPEHYDPDECTKRRVTACNLWDKLILEV